MPPSRPPPHSAAAGVSYRIAKIAKVECRAKTRTCSQFGYAETKLSSRSKDNKEFEKAQYR